MNLVATGTEEVEVKIHTAIKGFGICIAKLHKKELQDIKLKEKGKLVRRPVTPKSYSNMIFGLQFVMDNHL